MDLTSPNPEIYRPGLTKPTVKINFDAFFDESVRRDRIKQANIKYTDISFISPDEILSIDYDAIGEKELFEILKNKYTDILRMIIDSKDLRFLGLFTIPKFVSIFGQVLATSTLDYENIIAMGKIIYDYSIYPDKDDYIYNLLVSIARNIHSNIISRLVAKRIPEAIAINICISRYSCYDEEINIRRLNNTIMQSEILEEQAIVDIYTTLFDSITQLFVNTMYDVIPEQDLQTISPNAGLIYSTISLAVLDLLNVMQSDDIRKVLINYASSYGVNPYYRFTRFSLRCLSADYQRIVDVANYIEEVDHIQLP